MFAKFLLLAFLTFSAQTLSEAKKVHNYGLVEEAQKLVEQILDLFHDAVNESLAIIHELYENLQGQAKEQLEAALAQLRKVVEEAQVKLQEALNQAGELGKDAVNCVNNEKESLINLAEKSQAGLNNCRNTLVNKARKLVSEIENGVKNNIKSVTDLWDKFNNCPNVFCQIGAIANIGDVIAQIKDDVKSYVVQIKSFANTALPEMQQCNAEVMKEYVAESNAIKDKIVTCLKAIN